MERVKLNNEQITKLIETKRIFTNTFKAFDILLVDTETEKEIGLLELRQIHEFWYYSVFRDNFILKNDCLKIIDDSGARNSNYATLYQVVEFNEFDNFKEVPLGIELKNQEKTDKTIEIKQEIQNLKEKWEI